MSESREETVGRSTFSRIQTLVPVSLAKLSPACQDRKLAAIAPRRAGGSYVIADCRKDYFAAQKQTPRFHVTLQPLPQVVERASCSRFPAGRECGAWLETPNGLDALSDSPDLARSKGYLTTAGLWSQCRNSSPSERSFVSDAA